MRKYESIISIHKVSDRFFNKGDIIHVSEKIDGANASFKLDQEGVLHFYSRNMELTGGDSLRGFVEWISNHVKNREIMQDVIYYGEWVVKHKIDYPSSVANTFVLFDMFDTNTRTYFNQSTVMSVAEILDIRTPKVFYYGEYTNLEDIRKYVGVSEFVENGEGIVIKNETTKEKTKWVREDFRETKPIKQPKQSNLIVMSIVESIITEARVEKLIYKGVDEGVYQNLDKNNLGCIMKFLGCRVIDDVLEEEQEIIPEDIRDEVIKMSKKRIPYIARCILNNIQGGK